MTTVSEPTRVGDVIKWEVYQFFTREKLTAKNAEVLNIGHIAEAELVGVPEVQTNTGWNGTGTAGTYKITVYDPIAGQLVTTAPIADAAAHAVINAALDAVLGGGGGQVVSSGTIESTSWVLTYSGESYKGIDVPLATVDVSAWTGVTAAIFAQTTVGSLTSKKMIRVATAENASAICLEELGTLTADVEAMFLTKGPAIVDKDQLDYNSLTVGVVDAALEKLGIQLVTEPATLVTQVT